MSDRNDIFLYPPTQQIIDEWQEPDLPPVVYDRKQEAMCSSLIELEWDYRTNLAILEHDWESISVSTLNDAHGMLLRGVDHKHPGRFRPYNVRVGSYVPPQWAEVPNLMVGLSNFLHDDSIPRVLKAVWGHIMFESIHPYADGNGRVGRFLVNLILDRPWASAVLLEKQVYYSCLDAGFWHHWVVWMLRTLKECPTEWLPSEGQ